MPHVGTIGVVNRVNTDDGDAYGVVAVDAVSGEGVITQYESEPPVPAHILTQAGDAIDTQNSNRLITQG